MSRKELCYSQLFQGPEGYHLDFAIYTTMSMDRSFWRYLLQMQGGYNAKNEIAKIFYQNQLNKSLFFCQYTNLDDREYTTLDADCAKRTHFCQPPKGDCFHPKVAIVRYTKTGKSSLYNIGVFSKNLTNGHDDEAGVVLTECSVEPIKTENGQNLSAFLDFLCTKQSFAQEDNTKLGSIKKELPYIKLEGDATIHFGGLLNSKPLYEQMKSFWNAKDIHVITKPEFVGKSFQDKRENGITFYNHNISTHAKLFLNDKALWIGSANCSEAALGADANGVLAPTTGNVECLVKLPLSEGEKGTLLQEWCVSGYHEFKEKFPPILSENQSMQAVAPLEKAKRDLVFSCKTEHTNKGKGETIYKRELSCTQVPQISKFLFPYQGSDFLILPLECFIEKSVNRPGQNLVYTKNPTPYGILALLDTAGTVVATTVVDLIDDWFGTKTQAQRDMEQAVVGFLNVDWHDMLAKDSKDGFQQATMAYEILSQGQLTQGQQQEIERCYAQICRLYHLHQSNQATASVASPSPQLIYADALNLKLFQKKAAAHLIEKLAERNKVLLADETGLGKTLVALDIIAEMAQAHFDTNPNSNNAITNFNVVYVCSNARVRKINSEKQLFERLKNLCESDVNIPWSVHLYDTDRASMLEANNNIPSKSSKPPKNKKNDKQINIYSFSSNILDDTYSKRGNAQEREFLKLDDNATEKEVQEKRKAAIRKVSGLPNLMILDEFHRFWGEKGLGLIDNNFPKNKKLYLSATPYTMAIDGMSLLDVYETDYEEENIGGCKSFSDMVSYFAKDPTESKCICQAQAAHQTAIKELILHPSEPQWNSAMKAAQALEDGLKSFMYRNERAVLHGQVDDTREGFDDVFAMTQFKGCLQGYILPTKESLSTYRNLMPGIHSFGLKHYNESSEKNKDKEKPHRYVSIFPKEQTKLSPEADTILNKQENWVNLEGRLNSCLPLSQILRTAVDGAAQLLWVPPSKPYYKPIPEGVFHRNARYTKLFVFSNYKFIPRGVSSLISAYVQQVNEKHSGANHNREFTIPILETEDDVKRIAVLFDPKERIWEGLHCYEIVQRLKVYHPDVSENDLWMSLGAPQIAAYRILGDVTKAKAVGEAMNKYFTREGVCEAFAAGIMHSTPLRYCADGNVQAMLEEYLFVCDNNYEKFIENLVCACELEPSKVHLLYQEINMGSDTPKICHCHFSERFDEDINDVNGHNIQREKQLQDGFNSPFWPMIMTSTSVAQEGLDFHCYSHKIMHYTLPKNPMAFEQRDGRVDRYHSHLVRHRRAFEQRNQSWRDLFPLKAEGVNPHWTYAVGNSGYYLERLAPRFPVSNQAKNYDQLLECRRLYRSYIGMPNELEMVRKLLACCNSLGRDLLEIMPKISSL